MSRILIVLSAASAWIRADGGKYDSGVWAEEFVVMHETFVRAGCDVDIATPGGVAPTIDPHSMNPDVVGHEQVVHFREYLASIATLLANPLTLAHVAANAYDVVAIPGGHGPVVDLYKDPEMGRIFVEAQREKKIFDSSVDGGMPSVAAAPRGRPLSLCSWLGHDLKEALFATSQAALVNQRARW